MRCIIPQLYNRIIHSNSNLVPIRFPTKTHNWSYPKHHLQSEARIQSYAKHPTSLQCFQGLPTKCWQNSNPVYSSNNHRGGLVHPEFFLQTTINMDMLNLQANKTGQRKMILKRQIQCTNDKTPIFYVVLSGLQIVYLKIGKCQWLYKTKWDQGLVCERVIFCVEMSPHIILRIFFFKKLEQMWQRIQRCKWKRKRTVKHSLKWDDAAIASKIIFPHKSKQDLGLSSITNKHQWNLGSGYGISNEND